MAFITIPTKNFNASLTATEFNQILSALKDGTLDINTGLLISSGITVNGDLTVTGNSSFGGQSGPFARFYEHDHIIYVAKDGGEYDGDVYDGKSPGRALGSFQNAINNASNILGSSPSETSRIVIVCLDGATYSESIFCSDFVDIYAPNAVLQLGGASNFSVTLAQNNFVFRKVFRETGSGPMIVNIATTGLNRIEIYTLSDNSSGTIIENRSNNIFYINSERIFVSGGGIAYAETTATNKHVHFSIKTIALDSSNARGLVMTQPGSAHGSFDGIYKTSSGYSNTKGIVISAGNLDVFMNRLVADVAYEQSGTSSISAFVTELSGTETAAIPNNVSFVSPQNLKADISEIFTKEDSLGNPISSGYLLTSTSSGTRSWIPIPGNMLKSTYDPTNKAVDAFKHENHIGDYIDFSNTAPVPSQAKRISWNENDNTINIHTGLDGTIIQVGQEHVVKVYNPNVYPLLNGKAVKSLGTATNGFPNVDLVIANSFEEISKPMGVITGTINPGEYGFVTTNGKVRNIDTSSLSAGPVYLSATNAGEITNERPSIPNYAIFIGTVYTVDAVNGEIFVNIRGSQYDTILNYWNGSIREEFNFEVSSNGTTIIGSLEKESGGDLTAIFSSGMFRLDCTPAQIITLTPGTNTVPVKNYVYIPYSTRNLTVSTVSWPSEEHIKIADLVLQTASTVQARGPLQLRNWNDSLQNETNMGENSHIGEWIRSRHAAWESGCFGTMTVASPTQVYFSNTSGYVYQKHLHSFSAFDTATGDLINVFNHPTNPYVGITNIATLTTDATNTAIPNGIFFNIVVWGINNKNGSPDKILLNLPNGTYGTLANAIADSSSFDVYSIPQAYKGCAFLIGRYTFQRSTTPSVAWTLHNSQDLRGITPSAGGGISVSGVSEFTALSDVPNSYLGKEYDVVRVNGTANGLEFVNGVSGTFTSADGKTITVTYGVITGIS